MNPDQTLTFGPVPSRRLGRSLGINNLSAEHCSYACVYCQAGPTTCLRARRQSFVEPEVLRDRVQVALEAARARHIAIDFVSFVPTGEPTLDRGLGRAITAIRRLGTRVAVFTNGSLLGRPEVRDELAGADWVSVKVDAVTDPVWRRINRPHGRLSLRTILEGLRQYSRNHTGTLVTETMLVAGLNDSPDEIARVSDTIASANPAEAWLGMPIRPPAEPWVSAPSAPGFDRALQIFMSRIPSVRTLLDSRSTPWRPIGAEADQVLAMAAVHPIRESELREVLQSTGASREVVETLMNEGRLEAVTYGGRRFYRSIGRRRNVNRVAVGG
jgi:wyosine [tRNA(Phe)-imidazoG37] synthetase (radical SAM superfamily)